MTACCLNKVFFKKDPGSWGQGQGRWRGPETLSGPMTDQGVSSDVTGSQCRALLSSCPCKKEAVSTQGSEVFAISWQADVPKGEGRYWA